MPRRRVLVVLLLCFSAILGPLAAWQGLWKYVQGYGQPDYVAAPFFTERRFHMLRAGMTPDQVRECLGYPLSRYELPGVGTRWVYSAAPKQHARGFRLFQVFFDDTTGRLSGTVDRWTKPTGKGFLLRYNWAAQLVLEVGSLVLVDENGSELDLSASGTSWLVVGGHVKILPAEGQEVSYLSELGLFRLDGQGEGTAKVEGVFCRTRPHLPEHLYYTSFVYRNGSLVALAPMETSDRASKQADREWLIRRMAGHSVHLPEGW